MCPCPLVSLALTCFAETWLLACFWISLCLFASLCHLLSHVPFSIHWLPLIYFRNPISPRYLALTSRPLDSVSLGDEMSLLLRNRKETLSTLDPYDVASKRVQGRDPTLTFLIHLMISGDTQFLRLEVTGIFYTEDISKTGREQPHYIQPDIYSAKVT